MQAALPNLEKRIARLVAQTSPRTLKAISLEEMGAGAAEQETLNLICEIKELSDCRDLTKAALEEIDEILVNISKDDKCKNYGYILRAWYIEGTYKDDIAKELMYSSKQSVYDLKESALNKFAMQLYGYPAVKAL
jgi:hypothetical protein